MSSAKKTKNDKTELIWKAFIRGKRWAFIKIYEDNYDELYHYGIRFISEKETVKDLIHDLFLKLWKHRANISRPNNIRAYLLKSIRAIILDYKKVYTSKFQETDLPDSLNFSNISPEDIYIANQSMADSERRLYEELNKLPDRQKEAIYLHFIKEYSYQEVSSIMNVKVQSVRNFVHEGLAKLKEKKSSFL